jgi:hypothetical protein
MRDITQKPRLNQPFFPVEAEDMKVSIKHGTNKNIPSLIPFLGNVK